MSKVVGMIIAAFVLVAAFGMVLGPDAAAQSTVGSPGTVTILGSTYDAAGTNVTGTVCSPCGWQNLANMIDGVNSTTATVITDDPLAAFELAESEALGLNNFMFSIPGTDEIFGIEINIFGDVIFGGSGVANSILALSDDTSTTWTNSDSVAFAATFANMYHFAGPADLLGPPPSGNEIAYPHLSTPVPLVGGSPSSLWGAATITPAQVNTATFGIVFHNWGSIPGDTIVIDDISMEIFHGPPPPSVTSFVDDGDNTTTFTLTFDTDVSGVDASDFTLTLTGEAMATGVSVVGGPAIYDITVDGLTGDGGVTVTLLADGTITSDATTGAFEAPGRTSVTSPSQVVGSGIPGLPSLQVPFFQK